MKKIIFLLCFFLTINVYAQFDPCTDGSQASCQCITAPLLCSFDELDGYTFSTNSFSHPFDGPTDGLCEAGDGTSSDNPTWFSFVAGCSNIALMVTFSGCNDVQPGPAICAGLHAAVYGDCNNYYGSLVGCSNSGQCNSTIGSITIEMTGLIVGKIYHFLADGCCGSACSTVTIEVLTPPCPSALGDWPDGMSGPDVLGANISGEYTFPTISGGIYYPWYINGVFANVTDTIANVPLASFTRSFLFSAPGEYQLYVDAYNDCIDVSALPPILCRTITVIPNDNDGDGIIDNEDNCINISNPDQLDSDNDNTGDVCDNCPLIPNPNQEDCNNNGIGDICEPFLDTDCDGIYDSEDNCPGISNHNQIDQNNNNIGDACEDFPKIGINTQDPKSELHLSNGSLFIDNPEKGIILKDYQGNCFIIKVVNNLLALQQITCPN